MSITQNDIDETIQEFMGSVDVDFGYSVGNLNMDTTPESRAEIVQKLKAFLANREKAKSAHTPIVGDVDELRKKLVMMRVYTTAKNTEDGKHWLYAGDIDNIMMLITSYTHDRETVHGGVDEIVRHEQARKTVEAQLKAGEK